MLSVTAQYKMLSTIQCENCILYADLEETIYMKQLIAT